MKLISRLLAVLLLLGLMWLPIRAVAAGFDVLKTPCTAVPDAAGCQDRTQTTSDNGIYGKNGIITKATKIVSYLVGIAAVIMIMIGGFKYITSDGDSASTKTAKSTVLYALVGLVVALFAQAIVIFVINRL